MLELVDIGVRDYVDSSVFLRRLLGQPGAMTRDFQAPFTSAITQAETHRLLYRLHSKEKLDAATLAAKLAEFADALRVVEIIACDTAILERASMPMAAPLGALDAIHLASALRARELHGAIRLLTHNVELAIAARAEKLEAVTAP